MVSPRMIARVRVPRASAPIYGDDGPNVIHGNPNTPNEIWGYGGDDMLYGGNADDLLIGGDGNDLLIGKGGHDEMYGGSGDDVLKGGEGNDALYGGDGTDRLSGGGGDDTFFVSSAEVSAGDVWDGGKGRIDTIVLNAFNPPSAVDFTGVTIRNVERLSLSEATAVTITMTGRQLAGFGEVFLFDSSGGVSGHTIDLTTGGRIDLSKAYTYVLPILNLADVGTVLDARGLTYTGQVINGGAGNDTIRASHGGIVLHGGGGDDKLYGGDGSDDLHGDAGYNTLSGGGGDDLLHMVSTGAPAGRFSGGGGYDRLLIDDGASASAAIDLTVSAIGADIEAIDATGADAILTARQLSGRSEVYAHSLTLTTGGAIDLRRATGFSTSHIQLADRATDLDFTGATFGYTNATIDGGAGSDIVRGAGRFFRINGNGGDDTISGGDRFGILVGGAGSDTLTGGSAGELIWGYLENSSGSDTGADVLHGGGGDDFLYLNGGASSAYGDAGNDQLTVRMEASAAFVADGGAGDDRLFITLSAGDYAGSKIIGGDGFDTAIIVSADNTADISGMEVSVERFYGPLDTTMTSGQLNSFQEMMVDAHIADGGDIDVSGLVFSDSRVASAFYLSTFGNHFTAAGTAQSVQVRGNVGNDVIVGGDGQNFLTGDAGNDTIVCASTAGTDRLSGGDGIDWIDYSGATGALTVDLSVYDQQTGGAGRDQIDGFENIVGSMWDDALTGSAVANVLQGGAGADTMRGAGGADRFAFVTLGDFASGGALDRITDFTHAQGDLIDLSAIDPDAVRSGDQRFTFLGAAAFTGSAARYEIRYEVSPDGYVLVQGDVNHDQVADFTFRVDGVTTLLKTDFVL